MRPDKPGYWWYKPSYGPERIADIASGFSFELCVIENHRPISVSVFECSSGFGEWRGPAHPPKKVSRYAMDITKGEVFEIAKGAYVEYNDVKEFLIGEGDEV